MKQNKDIPLDQIGFFANLLFQVAQFFTPTPQGRLRRARRQHTKSREDFQAQLWDWMSTQGGTMTDYVTWMDQWYEANPVPTISDFDGSARVTKSETALGKFVELPVSHQAIDNPESKNGSKCLGCGAYESPCLDCKPEPSRYKGAEAYDKAVAEWLDLPASESASNCGYCDDGRTCSCDRPID